MKAFCWLLSWPDHNIHTQDGEKVPVRSEGRLIGFCTVREEAGRTLGHFELREDLNINQYVKFRISPSDSSGNRWLEGISLADYTSGAEKKYRQAKEMKMLALAD